MRTFLLLSLIGLAACTSSQKDPEPKPIEDLPAGTESVTVTKHGQFDFNIEENSGMAYSTAKHRMYVIEDSGNPAEVKVTETTGKLLGVYKLEAKNIDWEAISYGPCGDKQCIYVGDIGDNEDDRDHVTIYAFEEPEGTSGVITPKELKFTYVDGPINAEGMAINPVTKQIYIASKNYDEKPHKYYRFEGSKATLMGTLPIKNAIGDISVSPAGTKVAYMEASSGKIWIEQAPSQMTAITVPFLGQHESLTWISESEILYSSESTKEIYKITFKTAPAPTPTPTPPATGLWWKPLPRSKFQIMKRSDGDYVSQLKPDTQIVIIEATATKSHSYSDLKLDIDRLHAKGIKVICYGSLSLEDFRLDYKQFPKAAIGKNMSGYPDEKWTDIDHPEAQKFWDKRYDEYAKAGCDGVEDDNQQSFEWQEEDAPYGFKHTREQIGASVKYRAEAAHSRGMAHISKNCHDMSDISSQYSDGIMIESGLKYAKYGHMTNYKKWGDKGKFVGLVEYGMSEKTCKEEAKKYPWAEIHLNPGSEQYFRGNHINCN